MADVWSADDEMLGRQVALKFLHERFGADEQFVERFRREAQAAAGLQHPNIVSVYDRGEHEGRYLIAMEYVAGRRAQGPDRARPLAGRVGRDRPPGPDRRPLRARPRDRPPRPEAPQRPGRRRGPRARDRLRHRPRRRVGDHADRLGPGHGAVPLARAGAGPRDDRLGGHLLGRRDPLRGAHGPGAVRRRDRGRDRAQAGLRAARPAAAASTPRSRPRSTPSCSRRSPRTRRTAMPIATEFLRALDAAEANPDAGGTAVYAARSIRRPRRRRRTTAGSGSPSRSWRC